MRRGLQYLYVLWYCFPASFIHSNLMGGILSRGRGGHENFDPITCVSTSNSVTLDPPAMEFWSLHRATPGRLFPLFPNSAGSSGNGKNRITNREDTPTNLHPQLTQTLSPERNSAPRNVQQDTRKP